MKIVNKKITEIKLAKYNPRKINEDDMKKLIDSLDKFGFVDPVILNGKNNTLIGGHQRVTAWQRMGKSEVPCVIVQLDPKEEKALNIALNKISGDWDRNKLSVMLSELNSDNSIDVGITGFNDDELKTLIGNSGDLELILGENESDEDLDVDYVPQANIKMLQLYFSFEDYELVTKLATKLLFKLKETVDNPTITDVIKECVINECKSKKIPIKK